ncbi:electron transport complex subunit E [Bengtsoniella intestinalis]|uniref:electron transport complex subunit RsxE n=1 Tax=Bengtsoniella intestinalis TaxID=3073143 RepID=UPI00391F2CEA
MNFGKQLKEGLWSNNPVLIQLLGLCSVLAITTSVINGLGMGVSVLIILTLANIVISAIRNLVPTKIRIAMFIVVIAGFVTMVDLLLQAFLPSIAESLGVFIPLIVVNCIILGRAESFAYKNGIAASAMDGISQGLGYIWVMVLMSSIRELLGAGSLAGIQIIPSDYPALLMTLPVGGFIVLGCMIAAMQWIQARPKADKEGK